MVMLSCDINMDNNDWNFRTGWLMTDLKLTHLSSVVQHFNVCIYHTTRGLKWRLF